jgi:hypothetical protein
MFDLGAFNGLWVVCEANYVTDPARDSYFRSMVYVNGAGTRDGAEGWFVPLYSNKAGAEECRAVVCANLKLDPGDYKVVPIISLRDLAAVLAGFLALRRYHVRFDNGEPASVKVLLEMVVQRLT